MLVEKIETLKLEQSDALKYLQIAIAEKVSKTILNVKYLGGGSFGKAYKVWFDDGEVMVVKFLLAKNMLNKEVYDLKLLGEHCGTKMPKVFFERYADSVIPVDCYGMEAIVGGNVLTDIHMLLMSKRKRLEFADEVTTAIHKVHEVKNEYFGNTINPNCENWLDYYMPFARDILNVAEKLYSEKKLPKKVMLIMRAAWEKFDIIFSEKVVEACLIHGDLNIANIMVDNKHKLSGFIDPLNSMFADKEYDLFQFDNIMGKRFHLRKTYTQKYGASKNCDVKCAFYALWNEVFCYIKSGVIINSIMNPLVKNMQKQLRKL